MVGSELHRESLRIAFPDRHGMERWIRRQRLDAFHRLKLRFAIRQKHFLPRLLNYLAFSRQKLRAPRVRYLPPSIQIETGRYCLLKCPGCEVGLANAAGVPEGEREVTSLEMMKAAIDATYKRVFQISLHFHGEPLLNNNLFAACAYAVEKGLWTDFHSNLNPNISDLASKLIDAKLCNLVASIDGATQETYEKYRRGGDVELAFERIREIADLKQKRRSPFPWITAKFLVFEHNWHEIAAFKARAIEAGANEAIFVSGFANGIYDTGRAATEVEFDLNTLAWAERPLPDRCPFLWTDLRFEWDGSLYPCGHVNHSDHIFASAPTDLASSDMVERFNSPSHQRMRAFFLSNRLEATADLPKPCHTCELVRRFVEKQHSS